MFGSTTDDPVVLAWAAGFFDGDGHVGLRSGLQVEFTQKHPAALQRVQAIFPTGTLYSVKPTNRRPTTLWELQYYGANAAGVLQTLKPFLVVKEPEAELALQFWVACYAGRSHHSHYRTPVEKAELLSFREAMLEYRHRPVSDG